MSNHWTIIFCHIIRLILNIFSKTLFIYTKKDTKFDSQNFGYQIWFCTRLLRGSPYMNFLLDRRADTIRVFIGHPLFPLVEDRGPVEFPMSGHGALSSGPASESPARPIFQKLLGNTTPFFKFLAQTLHQVINNSMLFLLWPNLKSSVQFVSYTEVKSSTERKFLCEIFPNICTGTTTIII